MLNQYSPVPRARSSTAGKDATRQRPVGTRVARAQIYAGLGSKGQELVRVNIRIRVIITKVRFRVHKYLGFDP